MVSPLRQRQPPPQHSAVDAVNVSSNNEVVVLDDHPPLSSTLSSLSSNTNHNNNEYIWILIELVEYIITRQQQQHQSNNNNNNDDNDGIVKIPHSWKPMQQGRKRNRSSDALYSTTTSSSGTMSPKQRWNDPNQHRPNNNNSHHSQFDWGWCRAMVLQQQQPSSSSTTTTMTIQIYDLEFAPVSYQNRILQFSYDTPKSDMKHTLHHPSHTPPVAATAPPPSFYIHRCNDWWRDTMANHNNHHHSMTGTVPPLEKSPPKSILKKSSPHRRRHDRTSHLKSRTSSSATTPTTTTNIAIQQPPPTATTLPEPPHDLTMLEQLHEPAVLYCLYRRFQSSSGDNSSSSHHDEDSSSPHIYTYTGKILIAMNPFIPIPQLYGDAMMELYYHHHSNHQNQNTSAAASRHERMNGNRNNDSKSNITLSPLPPPPHIYAIAQNAYSSIILLPHEQQHSRQFTDEPIQKNQCILVSGESGAGKTVTTKIVLQYLARLSQQRQQTSSIATTTTQREVTPLSPRTSRRMQLRTIDTTTMSTNTGSTTHTTTTADASLGGSGGGRHIELQILESNPILESFGNARTIRNDNSSRFGKYIELSFDVHNGTIRSATIQTYLLEKVRLISQSYQERNYHIFYEILSPPLAGGLSPQERQLLHVTGKSVHDFHMTCMSQTYDRRDNVKDRDTYRELRQALDVVGFTRSEQLDLFTVVCALLYISNVTFVTPGGDDDMGNNSSSSTLDVSNPSLRYALELLGVDRTTFNNAMCTCTIEARNEVLVKHLSIDRAMKAVEAFIKTTYSALFNYIVKKINSFITVQPQSENDIGYRQSTTASIGVLDIFGFESFDRNSFEQLCINYCNEALQQQFNKFVFKNEQQEYEREDIDWSFISFPDNQDVLDLIEKRHDGILSILDEQCRLPRCTDTTFANALYQKCGNSSNYPRLHITKAMQAQYAFAIHHYAGLVEYDTEGFIEKNQDELPKSTTELLQSSSNPFFVTLGRELSLQSGENSSGFGQHQSPLTGNYSNRGKTPQFHRSGSNSLIRESVGTQFSSQLKTLRTRIESTSPHYVRCIKPNDDLLPNYFDANVIADQLRCAGVFEAIRVSRVGFPHRYFHDHFIQRYGLLERQVLQGQQRQQQRWNATASINPKEQCVILVNLISPKLSHLITPTDDRTTSKQLQDGYVLLSIQKLCHYLSTTI